MSTEQQRYLRSFIGREVITLNGIVIGKVHRLNLNIDDEIESLVILSSSLLPVPEKYRTLYMMNMDEIEIYNPEFLLAQKGAEKRLVQVTIGLIDRFIIRLPFPRKLFFPDHSVPINASRFDDNSGTSPIAVKPKKPSPRLPDASSNGEF
jgi:sporulation protein YlmC with PRC-barrel domain